MAQSGDNIKNLYDALKDEYDLGSEQDFRTSMSDKTNRQNLYNTIKDEYDLGTEADFDKAMGYDEAVKTAPSSAQKTAPKAAQSTAPNRTAAVDATATNKEQDKQEEVPGLLEAAFGGGKIAGPEARKTTDEPEKIDELAVKYQRLMNEQNRNVADYGRYYNQALGEMDKMPQQGGTIYAPVARYQEQLIADWLQKASPAETEKYNSDPNFAQQKNWEIFNQAQQVQGEFYKRKAAEMARNLVKKVNGGTPDEIQENLREAYFNKNNVYDINKVSNFLRMQGDENDQNPYLYYRRFIQNYYMPAIQNALKEKFKGLTLTAPGLSWDMNDLTGREGKSYDERWMNADERDAYDALLKLFHTDMDKLNKEGAAAFTKQYGQETSENMVLGGREGHAMQVGAGGNALRARNYAADPKKAVDDVLNKLYANSGGGNGGDDIDREAIGKLLYRNMMKYLIDQRVPKSKWGYVLQGFADSDLGEVFKTLTKTQYDRYLDKLANDKYVRNLNGFTGLLAEGGHEATKFLGDAWEYWLGGKAGNAITKAIRKRAIAGITADLTAKGIMESEARNIAVRIANARTKTAAEKAFIHSLSGAATLGSAGAISGGVQQILTPAGGAKKAEIQERRAGGEKISPEQERQEIAQANALAHSAGAVVKSAGGAAVSGAASGALFGTGALAGDMASKAASKYFGDLTSEAVGYAAKLNTNAAAATAMGQMEGAISGQQPEGSIAQQFARNVVNFAMLDGLNYAPKMLNRHPVRNYRQWKEYERSTGISEEDEARMRDAGYGDLIDTVDGLVSDRLRNRAAQSTAPNGTKDRAVAKREPGNSEKEQQETKINEGMLKLLADPRLPEELKRKYYMVVTGDTSRQLSPIVASEVSTDDDSKTRLVTYNKNGGVVSDREYRNEKAAKEAQEKIGHEQDENLTQALQQNVYAKDADSVMKEAYDAAAQVYNNGGSLNTGQRTLIYLYQHKPQLDKALQAMTSGEPLSDEDRKLVSLLNTVQGTLYKMNGTIPRIANDIEEDYGLGTDGLKAAREGHTEKEAKKISAETGEEIVHVGGDVWRTRNEDAAVKEYQRRLFDYSTNVEEGKDVEMPEPKGLPGEAEGEAAQSTAPNGTEPPTDGDQPPIGEQQPDEQQGPVDQQQPVEGRQSTTEEETPADQQPPIDQQQQDEDQPSKVRQARAQGRERGSSVMDDETMLDQLQYDSDYANQRLDNAFPDGEMSDFRDGLVKAVDDGDDDAIQTLLDKYDSRLSQEQKDAAINYVESAGAMEGIDDTIVAKTQQYQTQRKEELDRISDHNGNITMLTLADGSKLYYISGDLTNEYGGVIATDEWGKRQQIPVSSITGVGEVQSSQAILDNDTNNYAAAVEKHFMDMANGRKMLSGQRTTINIDGEDVNAVCDGTLDDGTVVLALDDGSKIQMSPDELSQTRAAARKTSVERNLAEADNLREMQAQEERFKNGIDDYGTSSPDIGGKGTKPEVAAEYLHEQDKKNGTDSKATLKDMDQRLKTTHFNERQSKREIDHMQDLLSVADEGSENYDLYKQRIEQYTQQLAEDQRRQRKIAEVRNAYMTPKEKQQMKMERTGAIDKARKAAEEEQSNVLRRTGQSGHEQGKVEGIDSKSLLGKYKTQAEADAALQQQRDTIMKDYRDGAGTAIADIQNQLREYGDGLRELDDDELSDLSSRLVEAQQQEKRTIEQAKQIKAAQQRLPLTYKDRNKEEVDKLSPREKRAHILQGARDPQDLLRRAREAYADSDMVGRLDDLEPETLEEYVSQNIGYGQFSWEGSGTGIARKRGLKEELGLKRGIGRNYDSNAINAYLAPKGQGESVDEVAHGLWEGRPSNMEQYDTQDMRNMVLELLGGDESARSIKYKTIQNRIDELESYEQAQEEQEEWYRQQAEEEERKRQKDEDTYKDYLDTMHAELAPLFDTVKDFLNGLYADEIARAEDEAHEQEEAWNEYLAEKEKQEQAAAEQRRTKTINDGTEETDGTGAVGRGRTLDKQSEPGGVQTRGSEGQAPLRGEEPDKSHAPLEDHARQSDDRGTTVAAAGNSSADRGILVPEEAQDHKQAVKLTRTGDFYEVDGDGADIAGRVLGITITKRHGIGTKMAGFPVHALDTYLAKLIKAGYPVDIIENGKVVEHVIPQESIGTTSTPEQIESERQSVNTEPTEGQKEAGNYKKGHIKVDGYDITIENPKGSTRSGKDASGKAWSVPMHYDYGYIKGTEGVDGDHIDVYLSDEPTKGNVYVVDQINQNDGSFDEHKVMYGFPSMEAAVGAYKSQYTDGWKVGKVTEVSRSDFKKWVESSHRKTKPFAEYKSMEAAAKQQRTEPSAHTGTNGVNGSHGVNGTDDSTLNGIQENGSKVEGITDGEPSADELSQLSDVLDRTNKVVREGILSGNVKDEAWKSYFHAKNAFGKAARRLPVKRLSELVDGKRHEDWYDRLSDVSKDVLRDVSKRNSSMADNDRAFDEVKAAQPPIAPVDPPKRISAMDFAGKDKSGNQAYNGVVYHDGGYVIGTDGHVLFAQHTSYPKELEGKTTDKKGSVTDSGYPKWRSVIPDMDSSEELGIDTSALHRFVCGVLKRDKKAMIAVRDRAGHISIYKAKDLDMFLRAAGSCNADVRLVSLEPLLDYDVDNYEFVFSNDKGTGLIMSFATDDIRHMKALYTFDGAKADGSKTQKNIDEVLDEVERRKRSGIPEAESKRKQFDPSVRKDLERFIGEAKGKGVTIDWEHSEPENAYIPMKIAGKASFVGVTEQDSDTPMTFPSDRPIAIYDIAEGGDIPDATKIDKFETYVKEYNSSKSLIEGSDDYASMDDQYPYVSFKSVDAAAKFNDWLNAEGRHSDGSNVDMADSLLDEVAARNDISEHATMTAEELKGREVEELRTLEKKEHAQADTDEQLAKIAKGEKRDKLLNDVKAHRANAELAKRVREEKEKEAEDIWGFHRAPSRVGRLTKREIALRDALNDAVRETGIEVIEDVEEGQRVLDMANDALLSKSKKRALETASLGTSSRSLTAISSADGAKVLKGLDNLVNKCENSSTQPKTFIGEVADALGIPRENFKDKSSRYATFETKNGKIVTIRISDHNATASNLDVNGQEDAISVVVTNKPNTGITNDGDAHIVEYYYNAIKLRKAEGKPLADIVRSIKQALYSGEFNDTTGLAERQEVNAADIVKEQRVYHGSGADFDAFDNSHMGEGEGVQAHGWGTYVTKSESVGEKYAVKSDKATGLKRSELESNISRAEEQLSYLRGAVKAEKEKEIKEWKDELANLDGSKWLYTVEIPDDTGNNYIEEKQSLQDLKRGDISERIDKAMDEYFGVKDSFYSWRLPGWAMREEFIRLAKGRHPEMSRGEADRKFSEVLSSAGVVGVHYDGRKDGDCYVIFNDKDLKITGKVKFFRTPNGEAYGYTVGGKIYEDPRIASSDTPIHEYAHLWAAMLRKVNPKEWENVIKLMKDTWAWDYVKKLYPDLKAEDEIADEALAMFSGKRGAEQARKAMEEFMEESMDGKDDLKTAAKKGLMRLKEALSKFWKNVCDLLHVHFTSAEEVADRVMYDMLRGFKSDNIDRGYREDRDYSKEEDSQKDAVVRYRLADPDESAVLDDQPTVKVYRAMQLIDGRLYPPMMAAVKGKLVEPRELGQWEIADERPDIIEKVKKNKTGEKIGYVTLDKGSKDATGKKGTPIRGVAYNPYWHTSRSPLNDQFKSAWIRPNIVTVEVEVPLSELTSGYRAKYAKDPVGETDWHSGSVTKQLTAQGHAPRKVILSRYDKPVKVLSAAETAERIIDYIGDYDVTIPENVVTPQVRVELEKRGIKIGAPEKGVKKTEQIREAIERGLSVSDDMLRDSEVFDDGERLPVYVREGGYSVSGLNNDYRKLSDLLDTFRDKYPGYVATLVDNSGKEIDPYIDDLELANRFFDGINIQVEPWRKYLSAPYKGAAQNGEDASAQKAYVARKTRNALTAVKHWADKMNLGDKVTVLTSTDGLQGKKARAKGWFVPKDGKITIVLPNHTDVGDVIRTLLHEGVAHYGLRQLFGEHFDTFLDNVYNNANHNVKSRIRDLESKYDGDKHKATEEYLAGLAEDTDFKHTVNSNWWSKIKNMFLDMLAKIGLKLKHALTDADLRYVLWRSYENMRHPGEKRAPADGHLENPIEEIEGEMEPRKAAAEQRPAERSGNVAADMNRRGMSTREYSDQEKIDMGNAAEELGETLGGVPVTIEHNGKDGVKGSFDTRDNTVHLNMDEADGIEDVEATVCHEVLGHEGLKALFGSNKGVDMFGQYIYDNASKELRRKIVEKADEEGYEWTDPLRFSKAAQEVFSDIASEGPHNAEEFSLWRKVKHYVIRALKSLGIRIRGIVNDHDLRYYVLKTGKAVKKWSMMDEETQREAAEPGRIMYSRRGKPRKRKDETMAQYIERLRTYERWKQAEEKAKAANDPMPEKEDYDQQAQDEYNKAMDDWHKANNIQPGDKEPTEFPKRKDGESPQEYAVRVADYESQSDIWKTAPNVFDYMKKAQDEYHAAYEAWKTRYDLQEMENVDEKLYSGEPISGDEPQTEEQHYDQLEVEYAVEQDAARELGDAVGMDLSAEGAQRHAKLAVIERRKNLESASADDAIFIHDLCRDIDALAKEKGMKPAELREKLIDVIESPVAQKDADKEVDKWVDVLNNMRAFQDAHSSITADGVKAAMPELTALSHLYVVYGVKPSNYEQRKEIHEAAKALADKFNDYYKDTPGYNQLFGDDIMQVGKYIVKMSDAAYAAAAASKLGEDPDVKAIVDRIHDWYDNFFHVIEDAGLRGDAGYVENGYINHIWDKEKSDADAWEKYVENYQRTKSGNMRHRTISTYADGIEVGLVPKFNDVAQIMSYYSRQNNEAIANKKFLDDLSFLTVSELNKDGEVVRTLPVLNSHHPSRFDEERYKMYHVPGVGDVWVLNEVSRRFSSIFGTMRTQDIPDWLSKTGKVYDLLGSTMKKIQLSISGFHALALTEVAIAQMGPINGVRWAVKSLPIELKPLLMLKELFKGTLIDSIKNGTIPAYARPEDFKFAASHLVQLGATQDYAAADVNMITERFRNYVRGLRKDEAFVKQAAGGALTPLAVALDFINKGMDKLLWNYLHDGLKIACFKWIAERVDKMVEKRGLTAEQRERLLDEAGQYVNDTFGGQYWELLNLSPAALKWMRRALLSPDWFVSTQRHFFANFGYGSIYDTRSFGEYVKESLRLRRAASQQLPTEPSKAVNDNGDIYRILRSTLARLCYVVGVCVFYNSLMNGLNAIMKAWDEEKEKEKADEIRKTNPDYKSPYELAYPDGMKWYDYTMFGNSLGQQTHLFLGRYADGTEMYVRWGKQFREFPEMFIGRKGLDFPAPMIQRMMGKANPVIGLVRDNLGALGIWGFENQNDIEEIQAKYGKAIGLLAMNARHFLPFSLPTQADKEFKMMDLFMPSSKGFTRYKAVDYFKDFIKSGDMEGVARTYKSATMNGIDAEKCLQAAITTLQAEQRDEMRDGIKDVGSACTAYDQAKTLTEKKAIRTKMIKLLAGQNYKAFTRDEAMQMVEDYINGKDVAEKDNDKYIQLSTSSDIREDYRLSSVGKQAKKFTDQIREAQKNVDAATAQELAKRYGGWLKLNKIVSRERSATGKLKKQLGKGKDKEVMQKIRSVRREAIDAIGEVER